MAYKRFRIVLSKGWTLLVCSFSVVLLALMSSCRSKKLNKTVEPEPVEEEVNDEDSGSINDYTPMAALPGDSKEVRAKIDEVNTLKGELNSRMNVVVYGPPEVMERRAQENREMREKIDNLSKEINNSRRR